MANDGHLSAIDEAIVSRKWIVSREDATHKAGMARRAGKLSGA